MLTSILSAASGFFKFTGYVSEYFKEKSIRDTQKQIAELKASVKMLQSQIKNNKKNYDIDLEVQRHIFEQEISSLKDVASAKNPSKKPRKIIG